jgi:thymidylate synthase
MQNGYIPTIFVSAKTIPQAWEKAVLEVWEKGCQIKTQYDKPEDPASRDATGIIEVENPFHEPRIHKNFPGGPEELESYRQEVVDGIHNHWINPEEDKWTYTYNERLFGYSPCEDLSKSSSPRPFKPVNQVQCMIDQLSQATYSRRAQAITWQPTCDPKTYDPPCLQRVWCRLLEDEQEDLVLNMNTHWRSRDLYKAWFMNVYALTDLQKIIAAKIADKLQRTVKVGRYVDIADSLHLYGSYFSEIEPEVKKMRETPLDSRVWSSDNPAFVMMTEEAKRKLAEDPDWYRKGRG